MADYEWGQPERQAPRGGGGWRWFWLLLGIVALIMFMRSRAQQPPHAPDRPPARAPIEPTQTQGPSPSRSGEAPRDGEWSLEEMPGRATSKVPTTTTGTATESVDPAHAKKTAQGDWQIEEVPADGKASDAAEPAKEKSGHPTTPGSKTTEGDWSIEELKSKQTPDSEK